MTIIIADDIGKPVARAFSALATASTSQFGAIHESGFSSIWRAENGMAFRHGVPNALTNPNCHFYIGDTEDLLAKAHEMIPQLHPSKSADGWTIEMLNIPIGRVFPRLARPHHQHPGNFPTPRMQGQAPHERAAGHLQAASLVSRLEKSFEYVDPDKDNLDAFGGEFRNILILAATEFETQCKGILRANGYSSKPESHWNTNDYFKLEAAARLGDYSVRLSNYPWIEEVSPFRNWDGDAPTKSLGWYDAYNSVKHDREKHFKLATVLNAISAVSAVAIIGLAQHGIQYFRKPRTLGEFFHVVERPAWSIGDTDGQDFGSTIQLEKICYPFT
ncbi:hypothetical protein [Qipengyuania mesophila]|uniref:hypothetical protein n=1 Tax=Qipengyuania mesophila TaxID=2867246 RepID=UPI0035139B85